MRKQGSVPLGRCKHRLTQRASCKVERCRVSLTCADPLRHTGRATRVLLRKHGVPLCRSREVRRVSFNSCRKVSYMSGAGRRGLTFRGFFRSAKGCVPPRSTRDMRRLCREAKRFLGDLRRDGGLGSGGLLVSARNTTVATVLGEVENDLSMRRF